MRNVYYVGFYNGIRCKKRGKCEGNFAASMKMNFVIDTLKILGYHVHLISISIGEKSGFFCGEHVVVDELEDHYYVPYFAAKIKNRLRLGGSVAWFFLRMYALFKFKRDDIVITYHSLRYGNFWDRLHKLIRFKWIPDVEEIYCLSRQDYEDKQYLNKEKAMFAGGNSFLFANDLMAKKYAGEKQYVVAYGNYNVYGKKESFQGDKIGIVYTGIINRDRGAFKIIDAMKLLPLNYELHILGFGTDVHMKEMWKRIEDVNRHGERVFFKGTKVGKDYTEFLLRNQIGVSLMDTGAEVSENAFPSKIMTYLGHSLFVVSSKCSCVENSKVADILYFCDDSTQGIADTILRIPVGEKNRSAEKLSKLKEEFLRDFKNILQE